MDTVAREVGCGNLGSWSKSNYGDDKADSTRHV